MATVVGFQMHRNQDSAELLIDGDCSHEKDILFANYYLNRMVLRPCINRRYRAKPWIYRREQLGQYDTLMRELREEDPEAFINFMRLPMELYDEALARITPSITIQDTWWRQALDPGLKYLSAVERFL